MNEGVSLSSGALLGESVAVFKRNWPLLLLAGAFEALCQFGQKVEDREKLAGVAGVLLVALFVIVAQMAVEGIVARSVFVREGIVDADVPPRFGAYMGVSILVELGVIFGMVLLIVPGVLLALRWVLAANFTLTREMGVRQAMEASRDMTDGHRGEIFGAYVVFGLVSYAPMLVLAPLAGGFRALNSTEPWSVLGASQAAWSVFAGLAGLALSIGIFSAFAGRRHRLQEVFA